MRNDTDGIACSFCGFAATPSAPVEISHGYISIVLRSKATASNKCF